MNEMAEDAAMHRFSEKISLSVVAASCTKKCACKSRRAAHPLRSSVLNYYFVCNVPKGNVY